MHLVNMHTMINENASMEKHKTDGGFYTNRYHQFNTLFAKLSYLYPAVDLDLKLCCIVISAVPNLD